MAGRLRVVLDTQIILRALINPESICGIIWNDQRYDLFTSPALIAEIVEVLNRAEIRSKYSQIDDALVRTTYLTLSESVIVQPSPIQPASRDPKDDKFLSCAKAVEADYLVSEDKDLLVLEKYGKTRIVNAKTFYEIVSS